MCLSMLEDTILTLAYMWISKSIISEFQGLSVGFLT